MYPEKQSLKHWIFTTCSYHSEIASSISGYLGNTFVEERCVVYFTIYVPCSGCRFNNGSYVAGRRCICQVVSTGVNKVWLLSHSQAFAASTVFAVRKYGQGKTRKIGRLVHAVRCQDTHDEQSGGYLFQL